jgi:hypothetical protein
MNYFAPGSKGSYDHGNRVNYPMSDTHVLTGSEQRVADSTFICYA